MYLQYTMDEKNSKMLILCIWSVGFMRPISNQLDNCIIIINTSRILVSFNDFDKFAD
jgi:hypothetical protein